MAGTEARNAGEDGGRDAAATDFFISLTAYNLPLTAIRRQGRRRYPVSIRQHYNSFVDYKFKYRKKPPSPEEEAEDKRQEKSKRSMGRGLAVGFTLPLILASGPLAGWLVGGWLDRTFDKTFWLPTLIILGTFAGFKLAYDMLMVISRDN